MKFIRMSVHFPWLALIGQNPVDRKGFFFDFQGFLVDMIPKRHQKAKFSSKRICNLQCLFLQGLRSSFPFFCGVFTKHHPFPRAENEAVIGDTYMGVSKNRGGPPKSSILIGVWNHYKPSILG